MSVQRTSNRKTKRNLWACGTGRLKWIYYYSTEVGMVQQLVFEDPLTEEELIVNGYRYLRSEKVDRYPWEE